MRENLAVGMFLGGWVTTIGVFGYVLLSPLGPAVRWAGARAALTALAVHDGPFDYTLTGNWAYRSTFDYSS
jgi:hypothetical protein